MLEVFFLLVFVTQLLDYYSTIQLRQEFPTRSAPAGHIPPPGGTPSGVLREGWEGLKSWSSQSRERVREFTLILPRKSGHD